MADRLPAALTAVDVAEAWKPWAPSAEQPWDRKWAAHLYRRAAFGAKPGDIDRALADGYAKTLERLLRGDDSESDALNDETLIEAGQHFNDPINLRAWWLYAMNESGRPLREKLTLFWHNHFATSYAKIRSTRLMYEQNITLRKHALGKFRPFLLDMSKDTAMLIWLDSNRNEKGAANENFAREVMELFSLGVGNYTEKDIQEAARAFTGWHHDAGQTAFEYHAAAHDDGPKTVLHQTGTWTGGDIIRICCDQPSCARFLVSKLYTFLVSETPPPKGLLTPLEERFRRSDYDIADLVGAMLGSRLFFSQHAYRKRVKWPVEFALEAIRAVTPGRVPMGDVAGPLAKMGQTLFSPPNVKGWRTGQDWLNSATLLARNNFAETVAMGIWSDAVVKRNRNVPVVTTSTPPTAQVSIPYNEPATCAVASGAAAGAIRANYQIAETPDMTFLVLGQKDNPQPSGPPPAPAVAFDPIVTLYAEKPLDIPALIVRMGELLYGDHVPEKLTAKLQKFLLEPLPAPQPATPDKKGPQPTPRKAEEVPKATQQPAKKDSPRTKNLVTTTPPSPLKINHESQAFKARVREALHAMMCLPEYQLN